MVKKWKAKKKILIPSTHKGIHRRSFLKMLGLSSVGLSWGFPFYAKWGRTNETTITKPMVDWRIDENGNKYFVPKNIQTDLVNEHKIVTARVDGLWRTYRIREFNNEFFEWWIEEKIWYYDQLIAFIEGETNEFTIPNGGHHHPMLSTYGKKFGGRGDSDFHLNTTVKGYTIVPKADNIQYINYEIDKVYEYGDIPVDLFKLRQQLYQEKNLWDKTRFSTLELYSGRPINADDPAKSIGFKETHTFQNISVNPMATLTYMSLFNTDGAQSYFEGLPYLTPHFEFRGVCWLISYYNPENTEYEKAIADYVNQAHCRFHGGVCNILTNIFLIAEQFNNTPGYAPGLGKRVVPPMKYNQSKMTIVKPQKKKKLTKEERIEFIKTLQLPI